MPIDAEEVVVLGQSQFPQFLKHARLDPLLKIRMDGAAGTELPGHRLPLATGGQDIENATDDVPHGQPRTATFTIAFVNWYHQIDPLPQRLGNLVKP